MSVIHQMNTWSSRHHPKWLVVLRVLLGVCLLIKGISFIQNNVLLQGLIAETDLIQNANWLNSFIPWLHLLGGSMIVAGLFTRFWCLLQIPVLTGAVIFVNARQGIFAGSSDLLFSIIILALLIFFFAEGGGPLSLDNYFRNTAKKKLD